ncbi:hypothetical protein [Botrimarina mediterranea]|uniref:hypothetical protein n=1 Tax=Botrimarina mediterranea TaxID=2528022 RepID=UPI0011A877F9|nr:hypothetical protein [Botrimarina mediterranea]
MDEVDLLGLAAWRPCGRFVLGAGAKRRGVGHRESGVGVNNRSEGSRCGDERVTGADDNANLA